MQDSVREGSWGWILFGYVTVAANSFPVVGEGLTHFTKNLEVVHVHSNLDRIFPSEKCKEKNNPCN
jgi:hypothetical protein